MTKCTDPTHTFEATPEDLERVQKDKDRVEATRHTHKQWFAITVANEPLLEGNLRIKASSKKEAEEIFAECLQRTCVASEELQ